MSTSKAGSDRANRGSGPDRPRAENAPPGDAADGDGHCSASRSVTPTRSALLRFLGYVWPYWPLIALAIVCGMGKFILPATTAISLRFVTDHLSGDRPADGQPPPDVLYAGTEAYLRWFASWLPDAWNMSSDVGQFNLLMVTMALLFVLWAVSSYYRTVLAQTAGHGVILTLRTDLYQHITRMSHSFFVQRQSGGIVSRIMNDIALAQNFVGNAMTNIWMDMASSLFYLVVLLSMDVPLTIAAVCVFPFYIMAMKTYGKRSKQTSKEVQEALEEFSGDVQERIAGIQMVKSFAAENRETANFITHARRLYHLTMTNVRTTSMSNTLVHWITHMATLAVVWYGGYRMMQSHISPGVLVAFVLLLREMYFPINRISELNTILHNSLAAIDRVFEVFDIRPDVQERPDARSLQSIRGEVCFERLSFAYSPQRLVLSDIDLTIHPGQTAALVGHSGAGKSTLIQLVPRFYDPLAGRVLIDGHDVRDLKLRSLRSQIGIVSQETMLFTGTVRENLLYGRPDASDEQMLAAARAAHVHDFVMDLPEGYDTPLGERGAKLSGGQKQRVAIARAFLCDPRILILDEATSALDSETEALIQQALANLIVGRTSIVIAHRLSTILNADKIVVMDAGRIAETGTHDELLSRGGAYARLYEVQFRGNLAGQSRSRRLVVTAEAALSAEPVAASTTGATSVLA